MINSLKYLPKDFTTLTVRGPFYEFFALNLLFQDTGTSYSLALKYSSFLFKFFSFASYILLVSGSKSVISKICPKISHFSQISHSKGNTIIRPSSQHWYILGETSYWCFIVYRMYQYAVQYW